MSISYDYIFSFQGPILATIPVYIYFVSYLNLIFNSKYHETKNFDWNSS